MTLDVIIKQELANSILFTEKKQSAEEYNYFVKLVLKSNNALIINDILSLRRYHEDSFQYGKEMTEKQRQKNYFYYYWNTFLDVKNEKNLTYESKKFLLNNCYNILNSSRLKLDFVSFIYEYIKLFNISSFFKLIKLI